MKSDVVNLAPSGLVLRSSSPGLAIPPQVELGAILNFVKL